MVVFTRKGECSTLMHNIILQKSPKIGVLTYLYYLCIRPCRYPPKSVFVKGFPVDTDPLKDIYLP